MAYLFSPLTLGAEVWCRLSIIVPILQMGKLRQTENKFAPGSAHVPVRRPWAGAGGGHAPQVGHVISIPPSLVWPTVLRFSTCLGLGRGIRLHTLLSLEKPGCGDRSKVAVLWLSHPPLIFPPYLPGTAFTQGPPGLGMPHTPSALCEHLYRLLVSVQTSSGVN